MPIRTSPQVAIRTATLLLAVLIWLGTAGHALAEKPATTLAGDTSITSLFGSTGAWLTTLLLALGAGWFAGRRRKTALEPEMARLQHCFEDNSSILMLTNSETGRIVNANQAAAEFYGWPRESLIDRPLHELWTEPCKHWSRSSRPELPAPACHLHTHKRRNGEKRRVEVHATPFRDQDGTAHVFSILHDVTERERAAEALERERSRLANVIESSQAGTWEWEIDSGKMTCNKRWVEMLGYGLDELAPITIETWQGLVHDDDRALVSSKLAACRQGGQDACEIEARMRCRNGGTMWTLAQGRILEWAPGGEPLKMWGTLHDVSHRKRMEQDLWLAASVFSQANEAIMITDLDARIIDVNQAFTHMTGWEREEVVGHTPKLFQSGLHGPDFYREMRNRLKRTGHWSGEVWNCNKAGELYAERLTISVVRDAQDRPCNYIALASDITDLKNYQKELEHRASHDELTGLPNRVLMADRLRQSMATSRRSGKFLAVAFLDLDGFKSVNDRHGHDIGDRLLKSMSEDLNDELRATDTLSRISGDEFVILLTDLEQVAQAYPVLDRLVSTAAANRVVNGRDIHLSASVGVTFYPQPQEVDDETLLRQADAAMYRAKRAGRGRLVPYEPSAAEDSC
ncbi:PAS domain S-box protein [Guyparkeria hydrothermalis]|uniref:sensor domain-containing protein n=1 Tax=Guyparkeria TaxID=2035712 RepID=UPI0010AD7E6D|nr:MULTISPECIES: sensor domain-containing diguanylate cyclase [Guyparkeria]MCL7751654.1 PAS domain S-box protein [Guyparkeria hydrothermalis]TKA91750.1 PAS domain S-box protein [Guyparkeria sp. SB14A]